MVIGTTDKVTTKIAQDSEFKQGIGKERHVELDAVIEKYKA